jgi:hypothetical protein
MTIARRRGALTPARDARRGPRLRVAYGVLLTAAVSIAGVLAGPPGVAMAAAPGLAIVSPESGSVTSRTPPFSGTTGHPWSGVAPEAFEPVVLRIYEGAVAGGQEIQRMETPEFLGAKWSIAAENSLAAGTYTAQAEQAGEKSPAVTFTVDTTPPSVAVTYPANGSSTSSGSQLIEGTASSSESEQPTIAIQLFSGSTTESHDHLETLTVQATEGHWSATFGGLSPGIYTARAEQSDHLNNVGRSAPVTFTVTAPLFASPMAPVASFRWFPPAPKTGENVSLVSNSTEIGSPITAFAWAFGATGSFKAGSPVLSTSFATPGPHLVRLRVGAADGLSSVATETVPVTSPSLVLMQPFPIVRIVGSKTSSGVHLNLLTVQAPVGARVMVTCRGRGCPTKSEGHLAAASRKQPHAATVTLAFRAFERSLRAGVTLRILVTKPGEIGKYTRFTIRRGKLPARVDSCLLPSDPNPIACPS